MDNLELMKQIPDNFIDLIYCDILYGTGKNFGDYKDLKPIKSIIDKFYISRIQEMHRILKNTGSIYLQMDTRISHWIRLMLDDIFGYYNFKNEIVWCYKSLGQGKYYLKKHDIILFYSKSKEIIFHKSHHNPSESVIKRWKYAVDDEGNIPYDKLTPYNKRQCKKENYEKNPQNIYRGSFLRDWWNDVLEVARGNNPEIKLGKYITQKPKALLERIIKASSNEGDIIADFFCGSGTTLVVAKELKRKYIGCDISEKAFKITQKRLNEIEPHLFN